MAFRHPTRSFSAVSRLGLAGCVLAFAASAHAESITVFSVFANQLMTFDSATPSTLSSVAPVTGLQVGESLLAIDFRPANGLLYGLGSASRLYLIDEVTGAATQVGSAGAFSLFGGAFGFDFNPTTDRIRVVSDADQNLRLNPNDGTLTATDSALNPGNPNVVASAYSNNVAGALTTTLYGIDSAVDGLVIQNPPNSGTVTLVGSLGFDTMSFIGFDISGSTGIAWASLNSGVGSSLYTINLTTSAATLVGQIGPTPVTVGGLAVRVGPQPATPVPEPTSLLLLGTGLVATGARRWRNRRKTAP